MPHELRKFFRCPLPPQHGRGQLVVAGRTWSCTVRNLSIGGFGVELPAVVDLNGVESAVLKTAEGAIPVQIMHVSVHDQTTSVGLARISEPDRKQIAEQQQRQLRRFQLALAGLAVLFFGGLALFERHGGSIVTPGRQAGWFGRTAQVRGAGNGGAGAPAATPRGGSVSPFGPKLAPSRPPMSTVRNPLDGHTTVTPLAARTPSSGSGAVLTNWTGTTVAASPAARPAPTASSGSSGTSHSSRASSRKSFQFSETALSELSRWSSSTEAAGASQQRLDAITGLLAEAAASTTAAPDGQVRTVVRDGVRIDYRATPTGLEVLRVQVD